MGGEYENYITPEGHVPEEDPGVPWETCMPMGTSWSWVPNEKYKSTDEIIRTLVSVVSRGGSLLLNVAPGPDGQLDSTAYVRLKEVGEWLKVNGEAVYGTRASSVGGLSGIIGRTFAWRSGERKTSYVFLDPQLVGAGTFTIPFSSSVYGEKVSCLGHGKVGFVRSKEGLTLRLPRSVRSSIGQPVVMKVTFVSSEF